MLSCRKRSQKGSSSLAEMPGVREVRIFGFMAQEEAETESDVDSLVGFEPECSLLEGAGLLLGLRCLLGCPVDLVAIRDSSTCSMLVFRSCSEGAALRSSNLAERVAF